MLVTVASTEPSRPREAKITAWCDGTLTPLHLLLLSSGSRAPVPERFQRGRLVWRRRGLVPVQRVRVVSRGPAESLHQHPHQDKTGTAGLRASRETGLTAHPAPTPSTFSHGPSITPPAPPPQPPTHNPTLTEPQQTPPTHLSISRGLFTSPALQNS